VTFRGFAGGCGQPDEVQDDLPDLARVGADGQQIGVHRHLELGPDHRVAPGREQLMDELDHPPPCLLDL
jgi:hypothetical protein